MKRFLLILFFIFLSLHFVSSATNITACGTTLIAGNYELNASISGNVTCLTVNDSNVAIDCKGYTISFNALGGNTQYGINVILNTVFLKNITIKNCIIKDINESGTPGYGIYFTRVTDSYIFNNTIQTNGTSTDVAITLTSGCTNVTIENNSINSYGTTTNNYGINFLAESSNNTIIGNNITDIGNVTTYAVYLQSNSNRNIIRNNNITAISIAPSGADRSAYGIVLSPSSYSVIAGNIIYAQSAQGAYGFNTGSDSKSNLFENNSIVANVTNATASYGVYLSTGTYNVIRRNNITTYAGTTTSRPIYLTQTVYATVENNLLVSNQTTISTMDGVLISLSPNSSVRNNTILLNGTSTLNGVSCTSSVNSNITDNIIVINGSGSATTFNGVLVTTSPNILVQRNGIQISGLTTLNGVYFTGSSYCYAENNSISVNGTSASNYGIYLLSTSFSYIRNNSVYSSASTPAYGIYLSNSAIQNTIEKNTVRTWGTGNANHALYITNGANENIVRNNTFLPNGAGTTNYGVYVQTSSKNLVDSNNISTNGTTSNHGVVMTTQADNNTIQNNSIYASGNYSSWGIYIATSDYNNLTGNNITSNGSLQDPLVTTSNEGIVLSGNVYYSGIYNNSIRLGGGRYNYGLYADTNSRYNVYKWNQVYTGGTGVRNAGIYFSASYNNIFDSNSISANGSATDYGAWFSLDSRNNIVKNNNFSTFGGTDSHGFYLDVSVPSYPNNNTFQNNNLVSIAGSDLFFAASSINDTYLIDQPIRIYNTTGVGSTIDVVNSSAGVISFVMPITGSNVSLSGGVYVKNNFARIDELTAGINKSANITLYNIPTQSTELRILRNGALCGAICTNLTSLQAGNVTFSAIQGGNFTINSSSGLPVISSAFPVQNFNSSNQSINFNFSVTDDSAGNLNCSIYLDGVLNQTNSSTINNSLTSFIINGIVEGNHSWYIECFDSAGNRNVSDVRNLSLSIAQPMSSLNYPTNNFYLNNVNSSYLNYTVINGDFRTMTVWLYGDGVLINSSTNVANGTNLSYLWNGLSFGQHNWSVIVGNGIKNSSQQYYYFNIINLTINCEAGGPYRSNALVLVSGNVSDGNTSLSSQQINASLYITGALNSSVNIVSLSDGSFRTSFYGLSDGNYTFNGSLSYQGYYKSCSKNFSIGGEIVATSASLSLDKIISLQEINSTSAIYNITLKTTNKGISKAVNTLLTDADSSTYLIGNLTSGQSDMRTYLKIFSRNSTNYNFTLAVARANATDSLMSQETDANSSRIVIAVPATTTDTQISLIKNAQYISENMTDVVYNLTSTFVNSGGNDLIGISISDSDLGLSSLTDLNRTQFYSTSATKIIDKASGSQQYNFSKASATYGSLNYMSNQLSILIPSLANNASLVLSKQSSFYAQTDTNITYNISLTATNNGGRNATGVIITDLDSLNSPYNIGILIAGQSVSFSYLKSFNKSANQITQNLALANVAGTDSIGSIPLQTNSSQISVLVPALYSPTSLIIGKTVSLQSLNSTTIVFNISLTATNNGGRNATNVNITDSDYSNSPYIIGTLQAGQSSTLSYLVAYFRNSTTYASAFVSALVQGSDYYSGSLIISNSTISTISIPATTADTGLTLIKNAQYISENMTDVVYNLTSTFVNSGGNDLIGISISDSDLGLSSLTDLNRTQFYSTSGIITIAKQSTPYSYNFSLANASGGSNNYYSNQLSILIPSLANNASLLLSKFVSLYSINKSQVVYNVTLSLTNIGGRNATNAHIYDSGNSYNLGVLSAGRTVLTSYLLVFDRQLYSTNQILDIASANATDSIGNNLIESSSQQISLVIPQRSGSASLFLDKIVSAQIINPSFIFYNISLRVINSGGSNATSVNILDGGYNLSVDSIGVGETAIGSYLLNFSRNSTTYFNLSPFASVSAIDSYSGNVINATSLPVNLTIPASEAGQQLTLIKNLYYNNQTFNDVNYTETLQIINSGGIDLSGIVVTDDDLNISDVISLNRTQVVGYSGYRIISKEQNNKAQTLSLARAVANLTIYSSNQMKIVIPGYGGGPNDVNIDAPTSVFAANNFDVKMTVKNMNPDIGQDFVLNYWLLNSDESAVLSSGSQTLFVSGNGSSNSTTIVFLAPSNIGSYKIRANVTGTGVGAQATALSTFVVSSMTLPLVIPSAGGGGGGGSVTGNAIDNVVCNHPYIRYGKECCLDVNNNSICDKDEVASVFTNISDNKSQEIPQTVVSGTANWTPGIIVNYLFNFLSISYNFLKNIYSSGFFPIFFIILVLIVIFIKTDYSFVAGKFAALSFFVSNLFSFNKKRDSSLLSNICGIKVYSSSGLFVGKIKEAYIDVDAHAVDGWLVKVSPGVKKKIHRKMALIKSKSVSSIGDVMVLGRGVEDLLFDESTEEFLKKK